MALIQGAGTRRLPGYNYNGFYVDQGSRRPYGTNVPSCSGYLLTAAGERTSCARHGFPKIHHRATSHIFDSDRGPNATCVGR
jgi:hypothetical protein